MIKSIYKVIKLVLCYLSPLLICSNQSLAIKLAVLLESFVCTSSYLYSAVSLFNHHMSLYNPIINIIKKLFDIRPSSYEQ